MGPFLAIARSSFTETTRQPFFGLVLISSCLLIALLPVSATHLYVFTSGGGLNRVPERMIAELGLATVQLGGLLLSVFCAHRLLAEELETGTIATLLTKPVGRATLLLGKYSGLAGALSLFAAAGSMVTLLTLRAGSPLEGIDPLDPGVVLGLGACFAIGLGVAAFRAYFAQRSFLGGFAMSFVLSLSLLFLAFAFIDRDYQIGLHFTRAGGVHALTEEAVVSTYDPQVLRAALLSTQAVLVIAALALAASARLGLYGTGALTGSVTLLGALERGAGADPSALGQLRAAVIPRLELFNVGEALVREQTIPNAYLLWSSAYALCLGAALITFGILALDGRDVT